MAVKAAAQALGADNGYAATESVAPSRCSGRLRRAARRVVCSDLTFGDVYLLAATAPTDRPLQVRRRWLELVESASRGGTRTG
jgi:hypothetical protein